METINALNELRNNAKNLKVKTRSFAQAVKACAGIATEGELEALGLQSFSIPNVRSAWSADLRTINEEGKERLALYMSVVVKQDVTEDGKEKQVNVYERVEGKKGVTFKTLKERVLTCPEAWTPDLIIEGLCQSRFATLAKEEAEEVCNHAEKVKAVGRYLKIVKKDENGFLTTTFQKF